MTDKCKRQRCKHPARIKELEAERSRALQLLRIARQALEGDEP